MHPGKEGKIKEEMEGGRDESVQGADHIKQAGGRLVFVLVELGTVLCFQTKFWFIYRAGN